MKLFHSLAMMCFATTLLAPGVALAGPGHDHDEPAAVDVGATLPRFVAVSDLFEIVGVLNGDQITVYLDNASDNSPVTEAQIELEIGDRKYVLLKKGEDAFEVVLDEPLSSGVLPITAMVVTDKDADLLVGELDVHDSLPAEQSAHEHAWWEEYGWWIGSGAAVLLIIVLGGRQLLASRSVRSEGAA